MKHLRLSRHTNLDAHKGSDDDAAPRALASETETSNSVYAEADARVDACKAAQIKIIEAQVSKLESGSFRCTPDAQSVMREVVDLLESYGSSARKTWPKALEKQVSIAENTLQKCLTRDLRIKVRSLRLEAARKVGSSNFFERLMLLFQVKIMSGRALLISRSAGGECFRACTPYTDMKLLTARILDVSTMKHQLRQTPRQATGKASNVDRDSPATMKLNDSANDADQSGHSSDTDVRGKTHSSGSEPPPVEPLHCTTESESELNEQEQDTVQGADGSSAEHQDHKYHASDDTAVAVAYPSSNQISEDSGSHRQQVALGASGLPSTEDQCCHPVGKTDLTNSRTSPTHPSLFPDQKQKNNPGEMSKFGPSAARKRKVYRLDGTCSGQHQDRVVDVATGGITENANRSEEDTGTSPRAAKRAKPPKEESAPPTRDTKNHHAETEPRVVVVRGSALPDLSPL
eukprot:m.32632 g.32632  ORF g.32632 m.32632 type:complete len:460 (-) comp14144_c0_seq2:1155-2534(-)